jgi:predicted phosphodiesterase
VYGHTHQSLITQADDRLVVNPGAAGPARFDFKPSVAILEISGGKPAVRIINLP